ncbi:MAG: substrate-binding domain-containing protein [Myxococcaceae bacterium]
MAPTHPQGESPAAASALLTTAEVAELLRVHPKHVYRLLRKGLPARRVGSEWRFDQRDVLVWSGGAAPLADGQAPRPLAAGAAPALVAGNGDVALMTLLRLSSERGPPFLGFVQADRESGLGLLGRGAVLAAGAHAGGFPTHLDGERVARIHLVNREIGLLTKPGAKGRIEDLATRSLASRPPSAGIRSHLDEALRTAMLDPERIHRGALLLSSHLEVVLAVISGRAEVGLATRAWGTRSGLVFHHLATESYGLIVKARDLGDARVIRVCEVAQGSAFRSEVGAIAGYDVEGAGDIRYDD